VAFLPAGWVGVAAVVALDLADPRQYLPGDVEGETGFLVEEQVVGRDVRDRRRRRGGEVDAAAGGGNGERRYLLSCPTGSGLLLLASERGEERVPLKVVSSPAEHRLVTSDPAELIELDQVEPRRPRRRQRRRRTPNRESGR
jgi:hypothetical protein